LIVSDLTYFNDPWAFIETPIILSNLFYPTVFLSPHELERYVVYPYVVYPYVTCPYVTCH